MRSLLRLGFNFQFKMKIVKEFPCSSVNSSYQFIHIFLCYPMNKVLLSVKSFWDSSIGKKIVVAITGLMLVLFLAGHLSGNMLIYVGEHAFNEYAYFLHHMLHGAGVWIARIGLLVAFSLHIVATVQLTIQNRKVSPKYQFEVSQRSSFSSKIMIWSGLTILAFVVYHILHFTVRAGNEYNNPDLYKVVYDGKEYHNAYKMVIDGFSWAPASIFYIIAVTLLCSHLSHGTASIFQTLGFRSSKTEGLIQAGSKIYAILIWLGFISIPISIWLFGVGK